MKKLLIATIEFLPQKGGVANYLAGLASHLPREKVVVLALKERCNKFTMVNLLHLEKKGVDNRQTYKIYRKKLFFRFFWPKWLPMVWHLWKVARREKAEMILVGQILPVGTAALVVKKVFGIPYFISCHGMDILMAQQSSRKNRLLKKILTQADGFIANSQFTKKELIKLGVAENRIVVVYPCPNKAMGAESEKVEEIKKRLGLANKKIMLTVGRLVERKGHDKVIEAMPKILEKVPEAVYVIVGEGQMKDKLQVISFKLQVQDKILLTGEILDEKVRAFYQLADIFVMVPRQIDGDVEGFGTVFLEANQFGKPVVAGRSGGVSEAVIDGVTGLLVDPTDTIKIAEATIKLLTDKNLANQLGAQGKERVEKEFRWPIQAEKVVKLLS